jgi:hypothetical protein
MARRLVIAFALLALAVPAIAVGSSGKTFPPTAAQRAAILKAWGTRSTAQSNCMIVLLAASNHQYGTVRFHPIKRCSKWAFNGVNVFRNTRDNRWRTAFEGSSYRCFLRNIPRQVQRDLAICPK